MSFRYKVRVRRRKRRQKMHGKIQKNLLDDK